MRVLTNLPLECFEAKTGTGWDDLRVVTYGPRDRMIVDGRHWPFDVEFDPARGTVEELWRRLPQGFAPDVLLIWWPDQEPLPEGLERCPVPVVGVVSDYNLSLPYVAGLWPLFDLWLADRGGTELFSRLGFTARHFVQYSFKIDHYGDPDASRPIDVAFAGNTNPTIQGERLAWIERVARLGATGRARVDIRSGVFGPAYGELLRAAKIGFNRSIRSELNLRAFEIPACGALALLEASNTEVDGVFEPGEEIVLYGSEPGELEATIERYLTDDDERLRIARNGRRRVQDFSMGRRIRALLELVVSESRTITTARRQHLESTTDTERALARGVAMLSTYASGVEQLACLTAVARSSPDDARVWNALAFARLRAEDGRVAGAVAMLERAAAIDPHHVPAVANVAELLVQVGDAPQAARIAEDHLLPRLERVAGLCADHDVAPAAAWTAIDGPWMPGGYSARGIAAAHALAESVRAGSPLPLIEMLRARAAEIVAAATTAVR
jgi:hypothetical protein